MSGLNYTMSVYVTPNVCVMEILYGVPSEVCFASKEYTAAKDGMFTTMPREPLTKIKQT
jgi:hypothetical protein